MTTEPRAVEGHEDPAGHDAVEMPAPTVAPLVLSLGMVLLAAGVVMGTGFLVVGAVVLLAGLGQFHAGLLVCGILIHATMSVSIGLMYGVLMPTLPYIPRPLAWNGLLMPLLWTAVTYTVMAVVNPLLNERVAWPAFIFSQFV